MTLLFQTTNLRLWENLERAPGTWWSQASNPAGGGGYLSLWLDYFLLIMTFFVLASADILFQNLQHLKSRWRPWVGTEQRVPASLGGAQPPGHQHYRTLTQKHTMRIHSCWFRIPPWGVSRVRKSEDHWAVPYTGLADRAFSQKWPFYFDPPRSATGCLGKTDSHLMDEKPRPGGRKPFGKGQGTRQKGLRAQPQEILNPVLEDLLSFPHHEGTAVVFWTHITQTRIYPGRPFFSKHLLHINRLLFFQRCACLLVCYYYCQSF